MSRPVIIRLVILALVLAALAAGLWYYNRPSAVVSRAFDRLSSTQTADFTASAEISNTIATQQLLGEPGTVSLSLAGRFDRSAQPLPAADSQVDLSASTDSVRVDAGGSVRLIANKLYFKLDRLPGSLPGLAGAKGQWFSLTRTGDAPQSSVPSGPLFTSVRQAGWEKLNSSLALKYHVDATPAAVIRFFNSVAAILGTRLTQQQITTLQANVSSLKTVPVDIWVSPITGRFRQLQTELAIPNANTARLTLTLEPLAGPLQIEPPSSAAPLDQPSPAATPPAAP